MASIMDPLPGEAPRKKKPSIMDPLPEESSALRRYVADPALSFFAKGALGIGEGVVGLADIATLGKAGKALENIGERISPPPPNTGGVMPPDWKPSLADNLPRVRDLGVDFKRAGEVLESFMSPEQQAVNKKVGLAMEGGFIPAVKEAIQNPSYLAHGVLQSIPLSIGGAGIGSLVAKGAGVVAPKLAGALAGRAGGLARGAIGEGAISGGMGAEQGRQESPDRELTLKQALIHAGSGALTGGIAGASGGLSRRLGITDIDTAIAGGGLGSATARGAQKGMMRRAGEGFVTEGVIEEGLQSAQEQAMQNLAAGKPWDEGVGGATAIGMLTGGLQGGGAAALFHGKQPVPVPESIDQQFERAYGVAPGGLTDEQLSGMDVQRAEAGVGPPAPPAPFDPNAYYDGLVGDQQAPPAAPAPDPLHKPNAGPLSRAGAIAVDTGLSADPFGAPAPTEAFVPRAEVTTPPDLQMQNRDRSRPGSIAQMNAIANNPDYDRLGVGRSPNEAAPMVSVGANAPVIPETDFGTTSRVVMGDGSKIGVRYAVVEADSVLASHNIDGSVNGDYFAAVPPGTMRALNNGRIAALQAAHARGTTEAYKQAMIEDAAAHGIAPESIAAKKAPVLVRVYDDAENARPNMGAISNPQSMLKPSASEQAQNDARLLDVAALTTDENGDLMAPENEAAIKQFLAAIPASEQNELVGKSGYTKQLADRVRGAVFAKAYGNADIVSQAVEDSDPETKNVLSALTMAAPEFAKVEHGAPLDVRPAMVEAIGIIRSARQRGIKVADLAAHPDLLGRDPYTQKMTDFMVQNARSPKKMAAVFAEAARFLQDEQQAKTSGDMFGRPAATIADMTKRVNAYLEKLYGSEINRFAAEEITPIQREQPASGARGGADDALLDDGRKPNQQRRAAADEGRAPPAAREPQGDLAGIVPDIQDVTQLHNRETASISRAGHSVESMPAELQLFVDTVRESAEIAALPAEQQKVLLDHYGKAARAKAEYDAIVTRISEAVNGKPGLTKLKGIGRAVEKIVGDYDGDASQIKDILRGTVKVDTLEDAQAAVALVLKEFNVLEKGRRNLFADGTPDPIDGYRDAKFNISIGGITAEVQVGIAEMLDAKENGPGHKLYEARQDLERLVGSREMTIKERALRDSLNAQMRAVYGPAWASATKARNAASSMGAPLRRAEPGSNGRGGETSKQAQYGGDPQSKATGIPSTSKNSAEGRNDSGSNLDGSFIDNPIVKDGKKESNQSSPLDKNHPAIVALSQHKDAAAAFTTQDGMMDIADLVSDKDQSKDPKVLAGGTDPRVKAATFMVASIAGKEKPRAPILVEKRPDGKYQVIDGNATMQAAKLAGWTKVPVQFQEAPPAAREPSFTLTGSERKADKNPAQIGLFDAADDFIRTSVAKLVDPARDTPKGRTAREQALRDLTRAGRVNVVAAAINADMITDGSASIVGREVTSAADLAAVAQVYRDPRFETLRYLFVKDGKVVFESAVSSRLPAAASAFAGNWPTFMKYIKARLADLDADGYYLMHNHPSGDASASNADRALTEQIAKLVPKFRGHVIIDTNEFNTLNAAGRENLQKADFGAQAPQEKPAIGGTTVARGVLGYRVTSNSSVARISKLLQQPGNVPLIGISADGRVVYAATITTDDLMSKGLRFPATMRRLARASGSGGGMFMTGLNEKEWQNAKHWVQSGIMRDAFSTDGKSALRYLLDDDERVASPAYFGKSEYAGGRLVRNAGIVAEPTAPYDPYDLFGNAGEVTAKTKAATKKKAPAIAALPSSQLDLFGNPANTGSEGGKNGRDENGQAGPRGPQPQTVPGAGTVGAPQGVLPGTGGPDLGSGNRNDGEQPGGPQGVQPEKQPVVDGEGGGGQQPAASGNGNRPRRLPGVPAGRDIPAKTGRNHAFSDDDLSYAGGWLTKGRQNVAAVRLLRQLEQEGRQATKEEQAVLAKYVGWGAGELANKLFGGNRWNLDKSWQDLRSEVEDLLSSDELAEASKSTQYAHYTSKEVVRGMWEAVRRMGFKGGAILEPGSGIGVFPGLMGPELANNTAYTGIEFEPIAGGILKQLFPDERIHLGDFIKSKLPKDFYDLAIGNPPFAGFQVLADPEYRKHGFLLHDYFFAKTVDRVKPGGMMVFVTSHGTMDKKNDKARQYLAERADLVGAIRLPQTAFKKNAGTEVVTDVLFLRKKVPGENFEHGQDWLGVSGVTGADGKLLQKTTEKGKEQIFVNEYFIAHPEMVLGTHSTMGSMRSASEYTVEPREGAIEQQFLDAVNALPENIYNPDHGTSADAAKVQQLDLDPKHKKEGGFYLSDSGVLMRVVDGVGKAYISQKAGKAAAEQNAVLKSYVPLRDALKQAQYDQLNNGPWEQSLAALQKAYKAFVRNQGNIRANTPYERTTTTQDEVTGEPVESVNKYRRWKHQETLRQDPDYWLVAALENIDEESDEITSSKALAERVLEKPSAPVIETAGDALAATLNETGKVDIPRIADLAGLSEEEALASLAGAIYRAPSGEWQTADEYLSGDVRQKLVEAMEAAAADKRYAPNVEALRAVQPREIPAEDINVRLGMAFIEPGVYEQFAQEELGVTVSVTHVPATGRWIVERRRNWNDTDDYAVGSWSGADIMAHGMSGAPIRVTMPGPTKDSKPVLDSNATAAAIAREQEMQLAFGSWLLKDEERSAKAVADYNTKFNTVVPRQFDGRHMSLPGTSKLFNIFDHVKRGAWRIIQSGNTYLAHAVGSGKTFQMIISAMEQKRLGLIKKPMMVVPRHMLAQFAAEWQALYPTARLMIADEKEFHTDRRREFVSRAALSDLDGIVITHSAFGLLDLDPAFKSELIEEELEEFRRALVEAGGSLTPQINSKGKKVLSRDPKIKQIEAAIEKMEQKLEAMASSEGKDKGAARFDEMGVDMLYVDEAHEFRRLAYPTQRQMKGIQPRGSDMAFDLWMKTRFLNEKNPGRSLVMASGTPVTNTVAELYNVMRLMDPEALASKGIARFDEWASMFGREDTQLEPNAGGDYENVTRFAKFANLPEMAQIFRKFADVLNSEDLGKLLGDKRPRVKGGSRKIVVAPMTPSLREYRKELRQRVRDSRDWKPSFLQPNNPDPVVAIIGDGRLAAIDMRYINPRAPSDPKSKLNMLIDGVIRVYNEANQPGQEIERGTQMVFTDMGFGEGVTERRGFNAKAWFQGRLREAGIPPGEVAFIGDYNTAQKRLTLFRRVNEGKVRVLVGGTRNLGTGTNAQQRLRALHHLDTPWYPASVEQREGRIVRAGNQNKEVEIYGYATKGSYDETMWKLVATKQRFVEQAMSGDPNLREIDDVSQVGLFEQASALLADDERVLQLAGLNSEVAQLNRLYRAHQDDQSRAGRELDLAEAQADRLEKRAIPEADRLAKQVQDLSGDKFTAKVGKDTFDKRKEFGAALNERMKALAVSIKEGAEQIGEISGFPIMYSGRITKGVTGKVEGYESSIWLRRGEDKVTLSTDANGDPLGLAMRAGNVVADIGKQPAQLRAYLGEQKARIHALTPKIGAKFPMLQELLDKTKEADELSTDIETNPYVDPEDEAAEPAAPADKAGPGVETADDIEIGEAPVANAPIFQYNPNQATPAVTAAQARQNAPPPKGAPDWVKRMAPEMREALRKSGVWQHKKGLRERVREMTQDAGLKILQGTVDQFLPILRRLGETPYKLTRMASAYDAGIESSLFAGRLKINTAGAVEVQRDTAGLLEVLKPLHGEVDRFLSWVAGNRAETLKAEDRENLFGDTDISQLKSLNRKLTPDDNFPNGDPGDNRAMIYARVLREYNEFGKAFLDISEQSGIINAETRKLWERNFYVPFYREQEENTALIGNVSGMVNQYAFKKLKGGTGVLQDLLSNSVQNWSHLLQASLKNNAAKATLAKAVELGAARLAQRVGPGRWEKGAVYVMEGGNEVHYIVEDGLILDAIASLETLSIKGMPMKILNKFKTALSFTATASPTFRLRNVMRDTVQSLASGDGTYNPLKVWVDGFKYSSKNNPEYYQQLAGGAFFQMGSHHEGNRGAYLKGVMKRLDPATILDTPQKGKAALGKLWDWYQDTGNRSENLVRAKRYRETYDALIASGAGHDRAHFEGAYAARDIMDFGLHGNYAAIRMLIQVVPFMNARMQGLYKLGRAGAENPRRFATVVGGVTLATIALALAYRGDPDWEEREEWDRDNFWWFKIGGVVVRIPKPFELGAMGSIAERALEAAMDGLDENARDRFASRLIAIVGSQLAMNPIPQAVSPAIQLWANKNLFTGRPIESERNLHLPTSQRIGPNTTVAAQLLGKAGILSPEQIDFLASSYFAWVGSHAMMTADLALRPLTGAPDRPAMKLDQYFVVGDFVKELPASQSRFVSQFYDHLKKTQEAMGELRNAQQLGRLDKVAELVAAGGRDLKMAPAYAKVAREMGQINARIRQVQAGDLSSDQKRETIDRLNGIKRQMARATEDARGRLN